MTFRTLTTAALALVLAVLVGIAGAQPATEITFYYPIAVGGPITKIVDGYAEQFMRENPGIRVKPVYTGTYQESVVKALTAHKSNEPPTTAILLSTDMFTLIDEDAIVPPSQAEAMVEALRRQGNPVGYFLFSGEQHGFRKAGNIQRCLDAELYFYATNVFGTGLTF